MRLAHEPRALKWQSLDSNPVLLTTNPVFPRCDHTVQDQGQPSHTHHPYPFIFKIPEDSGKLLQRPC